jgi:hypothetical protein
LRLKTKNAAIDSIIAIISSQNLHLMNNHDHMSWQMLGKWIWQKHVFEGCVRWEIEMNDHWNHQLRGLEKMGHSNLERRWRTMKLTPKSYKRISNKRKKKLKGHVRTWPRWSNLGHAWKQYYPPWYYPPWPPILTYGIKITTRKPLPYHVYVIDLDLNAHMHEFKRRSLKQMVEWKTMALQTCLCLF